MIALLDVLSPLLVAVPLLGALLLVFLPLRDKRKLFSIAIVVALVEAGLAFLAFGAFDSAIPYAQLVWKMDWFALPGSGGTAIPVRLHFGVDGLSILLVALTGLLGPVVLLSAIGHIHEREREFLVWALLDVRWDRWCLPRARSARLLCVLGAEPHPLYFIIGIWGGPRRIYATVKFFLYTLAGSLVMLVALLYLAYTTGTFDLQELATKELPLRTQILCFSAFALAFAIKVPMLPFHTWLPDAHVEAPTAGSIVLAGVLLKLGTYGFLPIGNRHLPRGRRDARAVARGARRRGRRVRFAAGLRPARHEEAHRLLVRGAHGCDRRRPLRAERRRPARQHPPDGESRALLRAPLPIGGIARTSGATCAKSKNTAGSPESCRSSRSC